MQVMTLQGLYRNLLTYELELQQNTGQAKEAKNKSVALVSTNRVKSVFTKSRPVQEEESDEEEDEEYANCTDLQELNDYMAMLAKKYKKFSKRTSWKQGGAARTFPKRSDKEKDPKAKVVCFNREKPSHFASECRHKKVERKATVKNEGYYKVKYLKPKAKMKRVLWWMKQIGQRLHQKKKMRLKPICA